MKDINEVLSIELVDNCIVNIARVLIKERNKEVNIAVLMDERLK